MEGKVEKVGLGIIKWAIITTVTLGILGLIFWALFYSVYFANLPFVIPLRSWYQNTYWTAKNIVTKPTGKYPPSSPIYPIQPVNIGQFNYKFLGTFSKLNDTGSVVYLKGYDNNIYAFILTQSPDDIGIVANDNPASPKNVVQILWNDPRTLQQILASYKADSQTPLNSDSSPISLTYFPQ